MAINATKLHFSAKYQESNLLREPNWRWERIEFLNAETTSGNPRCTSWRDDAYVRKARPVIKALQRLAEGEDEWELEKLSRKFPHMKYAYDIFINRQAKPESTLFLQARLLAGQSNEDIAKVMGITPETVEWYEALFYDVRGLLQCRDWITLRILLPALNRMPPPADASVRDDVMAKPWLDGSLLVCAYYGGPKIVDFMLSPLQANNPLKNAEDLPAWLDSNWKAAMRKLSTMMLMQSPISEKNVMRLFDMHADIIQRDSDASNEEQKTAVHKHILAMLEELPFSVGEEGNRRFAGTKLGVFDDGAAELRDSELMQVAAGDSDGPDDLPTELPPPRGSKRANADPSEDL